MLRLLLWLLLAVLTLSHKYNKGFRIRASRYHSSEELRYVDSFLRRFGYLADHSQLATAEERSGALRRFQHFNHLPETGRIDSKTSEYFSKPRCALPDMTPLVNRVNGNNNAPIKFTIGRKWNKNNIDWKINSFSTKISRKNLISETSRAFKLWGKYANLTFAQRSRGDADILIDFFTGLHTDGPENAFDGAGNVLAHAYLPPNGDVHFDDDEPWVVNRTGIDYFTVAAHELGHSLGLIHSEVRQALMAPYYLDFNPNLDLHSDDITGIQALYGIPSTKETSFRLTDGRRRPTDRRRRPTDRRPRPRGRWGRQRGRWGRRYRAVTRPNICSLRFNAVVKDANGDLLVFAGRDRLLRIGSNGGLINNTFLRDRFQPDAAFRLPGQSRLTFLKGGELMNYDSRGYRIGRPRMVRFGTAAIAFSSSDISVFGENILWKINPYSGRTVPMSDRNIRDEYPGIPNGIDAAVLKNSNQILFFKGREMYTFDRNTKTVIRTENKETALMPETCNV